MAEQSQFAWVDLTLPSLGMFYKDEHGQPLLPEGRVQVRKLGFREESILNTAGMDALQRVGTVLERCCRIPNPNLKVGQLLTSDRFAILLMQRVHSFGPTYTFRWTCPACSNKVTTKVNILKDLNQTTPEDVERKLAQKDPPQTLCEPFMVRLKDCGKDVAVRFQRGNDEYEIAQKAKRARMTQRMLDPGDPSFAIRLQTQIVSIDGKEPTAREMEDFIDSLTAGDSIRITRAVEERETGIDPTIICKCNACGNEQEMAMPFDAEFFRPTSLDD